MCISSYYVYYSSLCSVPERNIPSWAKGDELEAALDRQFGRDMGSGIDPDDIFGPVSSIDLEGKGLIIILV